MKTLLAHISLLAIALAFAADDTERRRDEAYQRQETGIARVLRQFDDDLEKVRTGEPRQAPNDVVFHHAGGHFGRATVSVSVHGELLTEEQLNKLMLWCGNPIVLHRAGKGDMEEARVSISIAGKVLTREEIDRAILWFNNLPDDEAVKAAKRKIIDAVK